jgi:hypothetical protein
MIEESDWPESSKLPQQQPRLPTLKPLLENQQGQHLTVPKSEFRSAAMLPKAG